MHMIAYTSLYKGLEEDIQPLLNAIITSAQHNNPKLGITGVLLFDHNRFFQIIEGKRDSLDKLLRIIEQDDRHQNISMLFDTPIHSREFGQWSMEAFNVSGAPGVDEALISSFQQVFKANFKPSSSQVVTWTKRLISEPERFSKMLG